MSLYLKYELRCDFCTAQIGEVEEFKFSPPYGVQESQLPSPRIGHSVIGNNFACDRCMTVARKAILELEPVKRRLA